MPTLRIHRPPPSPSAAPSPTESPASGRASALRKRRPGRPPRTSTPEQDATPQEEPQREAQQKSPESALSTQSHDVANNPKRGRGRGRPFAGGRWTRGRGSSSHIAHAPLDADGNPLNIVNDEVELPTDPEGETKVDDMGRLTGGRQYRVRTFTLLNKGERLYMLSTEPARCIGFRDSYLFFQKHRMLFKIIIDEEQKRDLIDRGIIPHSYKGRAIGVVTARSVFREFGSRILIDGRKVTDDYNAQAARDRGDVEGEIAVPEDRLPPPGKAYNRNQYVAWHGASNVYHSGNQTGPNQHGRVLEHKKRKTTITGDNWMLEHAAAASQFNSRLSAQRIANNKGTYDIHTNAIHYPQIMQPTHARWEAVPPPPEDEAARSRLINSASNVALRPVVHESPSGRPSNAEGPQSVSGAKEKGFSAVPAVFSRNIAVHDIYYESPTASVSRPPVILDNSGPQGLITIPADGRPYANTPAEALEALPPDCMRAFVDAAEREYAWKTRWPEEKEAGARAHLSLNYSWRA